MYPTDKTREDQVETTITTIPTTITTLPRIIPRIQKIQMLTMVITEDTYDVHGQHMVMYMLNPTKMFDSKLSSIHNLFLLFFIQL